MSTIFLILNYLLCILYLNLNHCFIQQKNLTIWRYKMNKNMIGAFMCTLMIAIVPISVGTMFNQKQIEKTTQLNTIQNGQIPEEIIQYGNDWPLPNKDYSNTRATSNSGIDSTNVANLTLAWSYQIPGVGGSGGAASNPLILGNTVYLQDLKGNVVALDFQTGNVLWSKIYNSPGIVGPNGPGVGYGKIFVAKDLYNVTALDMNTGAEMFFMHQVVLE
jgi:glucose dehydrogenase